MVGGPINSCPALQVVGFHFLHKLPDPYRATHRHKQPFIHIATQLILLVVAIQHLLSHMYIA